MGDAASLYRKLGMDNPQEIMDSYCSSCLGGWPYGFQYGHVSIFNYPTKLFADRSGGEATSKSRSVKVSETSRVGGRVTPTTASYYYSTIQLNLSPTHTTLRVKHLCCQGIRKAGEGVVTCPAQITGQVVIGGRRHRDGDYQIVACNGTNTLG